MTFTSEQIAQLSAKLDASCVKKNAKGFDHIEGWHAIAEANRIFGFDGWSREIVSLKSLHDPYQNEKQNWAVSYSCTVRITAGIGENKVIRDGSGFGSGFDKQVGAAHESALKEAETDAMKRALTTFGNQFGLALYDKAKENVEVKLDPDTYVPNAERWLKQQKSAEAINSGWSDELDNFLRLPVEAQQRLTKARDEALSALTGQKPSEDETDWKLTGEQLKADIDAALDSVAVREILESKKFNDLEKHSKTAGAFLRDRADKRLGVIMQGRRAA